MRLIDARSGREIALPDNGKSPVLYSAGGEPTIQYSQGEYIKIHSVTPGVFKASAVISSDKYPPMNVPLQVRWTHPSYPLQHVAFIPT